MCLVSKRRPSHAVACFDQTPVPHGDMTLQSLLKKHFKFSPMNYKEKKGSWCLALISYRVVKSYEGLKMQKKLTWFNTERKKKKNFCILAVAILFLKNQMWQVWVWSRRGLVTAFFYLYYLTWDPNVQNYKLRAKTHQESVCSGYILKAFSLTASLHRSRPLLAKKAALASLISQSF